MGEWIFAGCVVIAFWLAIEINEASYLKQAKRLDAERAALARKEP